MLLDECRGLLKVTQHAVNHIVHHTIPRHLSWVIFYQGLIFPYTRLIVPWSDILLHGE